MTGEQVNHPAHYGGADDPYEVIKVLEAWGLTEDAYLFNLVKYVARAGKKDLDALLQDLEKGAWYLARKIARLKEAQEAVALTAFTGMRMMNAEEVRRLHGLDPSGMPSSAEPDGS